MTPVRLIPLAVPAMLFTAAHAAAKEIVIETRNSALVLRADDGKEPLVIHHGRRLANPADYAQLPDRRKTADDPTGIFGAAYTVAGSRNLLEPAIQVTHSDGDASLVLNYESHETKDLAEGVKLTSIRLTDPSHPFHVTLHYKAYAAEDVIEQWTTIQHEEKSAVRMQKYASANLHLTGDKHYLLHYHGDWAREMQPESVELTAGLKVLDSKLGTRANLFQPQSFMVGVNGPVEEDRGEVLACTLAWTGNYRIDLEVDPARSLRVIAGINPYASEYTLDPGKEFATPALIHTWSGNGSGDASRNLHRWARKHCILNGEGKRETLLNNWEATGFDFNEDQLTALIKDGRKLGSDVFLLDDGWFANKYPRDSDHAGLGDWDVNKKKLPHGIGHLVKEAEAAGIKFGIWLEPEMVNPKSELYEKHPEWVIQSPNREPHYYRNQLVLDLSNPEVQDFVYGIVDKILTENPTMAYIKWDCNAVVFNARSATNPHPSHLFVDYVKGFYSVMERLRQKYPEIPIMLCSGGGGRADYGALKYFTEFWPSDNTDPLDRIYMQWEYSRFFPAITLGAHVTNWGKQPLKYRTDVALMGKFGHDIVVSHLDEKELKFTQDALLLYKRISGTTLHGDLYRLVAPYGRDFASLAFVSPTKDKAVWFSYLITGSRKNLGTDAPVKLKGLNPEKIYSVREVNLFPGTTSPIGEVKLSGDYLMTIGFNPQVMKERQSVILELSTAE